ncbi:hypothetical protein FFF93_014705 [Arthrobacter sp. KBS0702]|uniref:hypothetical protein n=1 Tax=Arthrobacter sp. KBS0702 TaxID=2578107 RepID=UPI00110DFC76|nr:hypothetical protein [Arthrobacter sp. KBS0702]QDW30884.1 hypothetical protein FFF93_014705 [Arthrobacter sp. KBS0702]
METFLWPGCAQHQEGELKVAAVLPGAGYKVEAPLLYWPAEMLKDRGWHVRAVRWTNDEPGDDPHGFAARAVEQAFAEAPAAGQRLIVAKSFGTFAMPWADAANVPAIWLTPILTDDVIRRTLSETSKSDLLIGGERDKFWVTAGLTESAATFVEIHDADHSLQVPNDWRASQAVQAQAFTAVERFVATIGA